MTIQLTKEGLRQIFPAAPQDVIDAFVTKQAVLDKAGITHTRTRLAYFFANIEHECGGFTIKNLTENILGYTHERIAQLWKSRFPGGAAEVRNRFGSGPGWQYKAFDAIYGNRMGNRPGTSDGSAFIGRGGPQWTGRDGYAACGRITGLAAVDNPVIVCRHDVQPEVSSAFWTWKGLNRHADTGAWLTVVKLWNGGTNGLEDRNARRAGNDAAIRRFPDVNTAKTEILDTVKNLPGSPPTPVPPPEVEKEATKTERQTRTGGVATAGAGAGAEAGKATGTVAADNPVTTPFVTYTLIGVGVAVIIVATVLIVRKVKAVRENWF